MARFRGLGLLRRWGLLGLGLGVLVGLILVMGLGSQAMASACPTTDDIYTGSGSWWTASNWSKGAWPTPSQTACWGAGQTVTVDASGYTATAQAIDAQGDLVINGGSLGMANISTPEQSTVANLTLEGGGSFCGPSAATLTFTGNFDWHGAGYLNAYCNSGMTIQQQGSGSFTIDGSGQADIGPGPLQATGPVSITNPGFANANASWTSSLTTPGVVTVGPGSYGGSVVGTTFVSAGGLATSSGNTDLPNWALTLTASTSVLASSGELSVVNLATNPNTNLTVPAGYTLNDGGGNLKGTLGGGGTVNLAEMSGGANTELFSGATLDPAAVSLPCPACSGRILTVDSGATFSPSAVDINGGSLVVDQSSQVDDLTLEQGSLSGPAGVTLTFTGNFDWNPSQSPGYYDYCTGCQMAIEQQGSGSFKIEGTNQAVMGQGTMHATGPVLISNPGFATQSSAWPGSLDTPGDVSVAPVSYGGNNNLSITAGGLAISSPGTVSAPWNLTLNGGTNGQMVTDIPSGEQLTVNALKLTGGTLQGTGTVTAPVTNSGGTVAPGEGSPGTLTVNGGYEQDAGGSLAIDANGTATGQYSVLAVSGAAKLGGAMTLAPSQSYAGSASQGDTFGILSYSPGSLSGQFSSASSIPALRDGEPVSADYSHSGVVHLVVGAPNVQIVTVPVDPTKPNTSADAVPHQGVAGRNVTLGAIVRGLTDPSGWSYHWDCTAFGWHSPTLPVQSVYDLGATVSLPALLQSAELDFTITLDGPGGATASARYPVYDNVGMPQSPASATPAQLSALRAMAIDSALWYEHLAFTTRGGTGSALYGSTGDPNDYVDQDANVLELLEKTGHLPAFPLGSYDAMGGTTAPPAGNDVRWNGDPYAEDALRLTNELLDSLVAVPVSSADESRDGVTVVAGSNDGLGYAVYTPGGVPGNGRTGDVLQALAQTGLENTLVQGTTYNGNGVIASGRSLAFVDQELVDYLASAQMQSDAGWAYGAWDWWGSPEQTNRIYAVMTGHVGRGVYGGLVAATRLSAAGVYINQRLRTGAATALNTLTDAYGSPFGQYPYTGLPFAESESSGPSLEDDGAAIMASGLLGWNTNSDPTTRAGALFNGYISALGRYWSQQPPTGPPGEETNDRLFLDPVPGYPDPSNLYALYNTASGLESLSTAPQYAAVDGHDWYREFTVSLLPVQQPDGSWDPQNLGTYGDMTAMSTQPIATAWAAMTLAPVAGTSTVEPPPPALTVNVAGSGAGTVTSAPVGVSCQASCNAAFDQNTQVTLTPAPAAGSTFTGWSGACTGTGSCTVTMNADQAVTATFQRQAPLCATTTPSVTVANDGASQSVALDGSRSSDPVGGALTYSWTTNGPGSLNTPTGARATDTFNGAGYGADKSWVDTLTVSNGVFSSSCTVHVDVSDTLPPRFTVTPQAATFVRDGSLNQNIARWLSKVQASDPAAAPGTDIRVTNDYQLRGGTYRETVTWIATNPDNPSAVAHVSALLTVISAAATPASAITVGPTGAATTQIACNLPQPCVGNLKLILPPRPAHAAHAAHAALLLGQASLRIKPHQRARVIIRLTPAGRRLLARRTTKVTEIIRLQAPNGAWSTIRRTISLTYRHH